INTRREKFRDPRVREALIQAFDFEWTNKTIMYGAYARTHSPFQNSDMMVTGPPSLEELKLLEPFRGQVPDEVFGSPFVPPVSGGSGQDRTLLRQGSQRVQDAGLVMKDGKRLLPNGEVFKIEFLVDEPSIQPHHAPYIKNLGTLGIEATLRGVGAGQYRARVEDFDFDMTIERFSMSATPGDGMRPFFSSQAAATKGSYNLAGIANPAIDALIEKILGAENRADLTAACRAFDRGFRAGRDWGPQWDPLLGCVRTPGKTAALRARRRRAGKLVVRREQSGQGRAGEIIHERIYRPPDFPDDSHVAGNPVRLLCCGAVCAGRAGGAGDRPAQRRRHRRQLADFGGLRRRFRCADPGRRLRRRRRLEISRRAGARSGFHHEPGEAVGLPQPGAGGLR